MKKIIGITLLATLALGTTAFAGEDAERGKMLFEQNCSACHGLDAKGVQGLGKDLTTSEFAAGKSDEEMVAFVKEGRAADHPLNTTGILMPPKAGNPALSDDDIKAIISYMRSLEKKS